MTGMPERLKETRSGTPIAEDFAGGVWRFWGYCKLCDAKAWIRKDDGRCEGCYRKPEEKK